MPQVDSSCHNGGCRGVTSLPPDPDTISAFYDTITSVLSSKGSQASPAVSYVSSSWQDVNQPQIQAPRASSYSDISGEITSASVALPTSSDAVNLSVVLMNTQIALSTTASGLSPMPTIKTYIGPSQWEAGYRAGQYALSLLPSGGNVYIITGGNDVRSRRRVKGFKKAIGSSLTVINEQSAGWSKSAAKSLMDSVISGTTINLIFACSDTMAIGAHGSSNVASVPTIGIGGDTSSLGSGLSATVGFYPNLMAGQAIEEISYTYNGSSDTSSAPRYIRTPVLVVDSTNTTTYAAGDKYDSTTTTSVSGNYRLVQNGTVGSVVGSEEKDDDSALPSNLN